MTRYHVILALAITAVGSPAAASDGPRTLDDYVALARAHHAGLQASASRARAAREHVGVARGFPDPMLLYGYYFGRGESEMDGRQELMLSQEIPFFGKRGLRGDVASREADMAARMADAMALDVDFEVKMMFYDYVHHSELVRVLDEEERVLRRMREIAQVRYSSGTAEQQDVLKLELAVSQLENEQAIHHRGLATARARLNELVGRQADEPLPAPEWKVPDVASLEARALADTAGARRPEIAAADAEIEAADLARRLARREHLPDFVLGVTWEFGGEMDDMWEVMAGVNLPVWIGKRRAMVREAEAMRESAEHRRRAETLRVSREVEDALARVHAARERFDRFQTRILPQAEQTFASSEAGYRAGRVEFLDYLDSERMLLSMRKDYYEVIADLGMQAAALERAIGSRE